jgi:hypothetical protein
MNNVFIKNANIAAGNGAHGQFFMSGNTQLTHQKDIQSHIKPLSYLEGDRHAATGQAEDGHIGPVGEARQFFGQRPPRLCAIFKTKAHGLDHKPG